MCVCVCACVFLFTALTSLHVPFCFFALPLFLFTVMSPCFGTFFLPFLLRGPWPAKGVLYLAHGLARPGPPRPGLSRVAQKI